MRVILKRTAETLLVRSGLATLSARGMKGEAFILAYHNIVPSGENAWGEKSLHLDAREFRNHLDVVSSHARVAPLDEILSPETAVGRSDDPRPRVAVTFDDAYRGAVEAGLEVLREFDISATYFAAPGLIEEPGFWWDRLAAARDGRLPGRFRDHVLDEFKGAQHLVIKEFGERGELAGPAPEYARPAGYDTLKALSGVPGHRIEHHTWSHPNLTRLTGAERAEEFRKATQWLHDCTGRKPSFLAYPYGLQDDDVRESSRQHGLAAGFMVEGGRLPGAGMDRFRVPRLNVPSGLTATGLRLRLAGLLNRS